MLVVADQATVRITRERRLAGARQPEEERGVAALADVGRAVHRQHALLRQRVVEDGKDRLLDLAGIARAANQHHFPAEMHEDEHVGPRAVARGVSLEIRRVDDGELREVLGAPSGVVLREEHVPGEQVVPGEFVDDSDREPVRGVGARPGVQDVQLLVLEVVQHVAVKRIELVRVDRTVDAAPVHVLLARRFAHDELVVRGPAGVLARPADEGTLGGQRAFTAVDRLLVQRRWAQIPMDTPGPHEAQGFEPMRPFKLHAHSRELHLSTVSVGPPEEQNIVPVDSEPSQPGDGAATAGLQYSDWAGSGVKTASARARTIVATR